MERMSGTDALLWHLESANAPVHTLKTAIVDPKRLGRFLTLADLHSALEPRLGLLPRLTQRVEAAPGFPGRPFWIEDKSFDLGRHLDEARLPAPGGRAELDDLHGHLATVPLDRGRPLWSATLVHGVVGDRQAVIVRVHHAVTDGLGALNSFLRLTADGPEAPVATGRRPPAVTPSTGMLRDSALGEVPRALLRLAPLSVHAAASARRARRFRREHPDLPPFLGTRRTFANRSSGATRRCASSDLDFVDLRDVSKAAGVTINGVYHSLIAAAMRDELLRRGEDASLPTVASFGIAAEPSSERVHGNRVTPTVVSLFSDRDDPLDRLVQTARSCRDGVELRKRTGVQMTGRWADYTCRLGPLFVRLMGNRSPRIVNHITTANVPGPVARRWAGAVEVVDWISFAIVINPSNINITAYSYAGRMSIGLVTTPEVLPEPHLFLGRMEEELDVLRRRLVG